MTAATQGDADAIAAAIATLTNLVVSDDAQINTAVSAIAAALAAAGNANPGVDLSAAQAAVTAAQAAIADLGNAAASVSALVPAPPAEPTS
jgi:hypothetical protein